MPSTARDLSDLEAKLTSGKPLARSDAERMLACADLVSVGGVGQAARVGYSNDRVTFGRVALVKGLTLPESRGSAGEVRVSGTPASIDDARAWVRQAASFAGGVPLSAFSAADLYALVDHDHVALLECARALHADGLEAIAETPVDRCESIDALMDLVHALTRGGLGVWRLTVDRASRSDMLDLIERAATLQERTGSVRAFAPLARHDSPETPSTGYDDVRTIAVASALCREIPMIQVDWPLYGPKLAQVAIAYGANDIDGVDAVDSLELGPRRSSGADVARQIRSAGGAPAERNGRYEILS